MVAFTNFTFHHCTIVDTFEDPDDKAAEKSANELLQWWNRYV